GNIGNIPTSAYITRWTAENYQNARWPKATGGYTRSYKISDRYVEDASYLRLKNVSLSYNWPRPFQGVENLQFSLTGTNLLTLTRYSWFDPDVNAFGSDSSRRGVDIYSYPLCRTISFGIVSTF
ncbi:MAG: SusC/RagA family protein, partial [Bacteroidaceae bacterium]|nr:SusC/RagA family protein [Bacteroidaceae bacterium]